MTKKLENWKKILESDLDYIVGEVRNMAQPPAVILLSGPVGAGKTTFTKKFLQVNTHPSAHNQSPIKAITGQMVTGQDLIQSPTYAIVSEVGKIAHADFYRIENQEELIHLELPLQVEGKDYFLVEWGKPYLNELQRQLGQDYKYYEIVIEINEGHFVDGDKGPSRNIILSQIDV